MKEKQKIKEGKVSSEKSIGCKESIARVDETLDTRKDNKVNTLNYCDPEHKECNCGDDTGNSVGQKTDLIVLIDTSGSMESSASSISNAVEDAIDKAREECEPDLRITYLGVDGTWPGTLFTQSHREYITDIHGSVPLQADTNHVGLKSEQGANAIEDLSKYFDWRDEACKAIFYISDEELDSVYPTSDFANETAATNAAITEANANDVTVFANYLTYHHRAPQITQNYQDLCDDTGGKAYLSDAPDKEEYVDILSEVICNSCGVSGCKEVSLPEIEPCISIKWGDSECDCIESSDFEVMTITVCNCYKNISFRDFIISSIEVFDASGNPVSVLPNGTPSIKLHPIGIYCFGDIESCSCVTREFVLLTEGVEEGEYRLSVKGICFDVKISENIESECFEFTICKD